ncbi:hypothetical protein [Synechococcus sp. WH 8016]|jgi:hypothetical protein|uniref:hypothetical protein n=1 Tax=Synechococcus sp. WH 8016 TaxID=166318 RepID=UPI00022D8DEA|nr:hypothetical protein [Synechococcus sp. WH 8016]EHA63572.1 hypothetical protein Syn8016DRAFT_0613 [Synechococcus sp. WH 8016]MDB4379724.1 hypothetical protein [bacterium]
MPQLNSGWTREAQQVKPNLAGLPVRSAIDIAMQDNAQELKEELRSQPFYIAPTRTQPGHKIKSISKTASIKKAF